MVGPIFVWLTAFFLIVALLFLIVYQLMCFADLEFDYINPYDSASRINIMIWPEFALHGILCLLFLSSGHWFMSLCCVPMIYYNWRLYEKREHLVDVTEIFNQLHREKKRRLMKLIYLGIFLIVSFFWMILSVIAVDE